MNLDSLSAEGLTKHYRGRCVLGDFSLDVRRGEIVGLLGPSGSGKSTIFKILTGVIKPDVGEVFLGNKKVTSLNIEARSNYGLGYVSQSSTMFDSLSVQQNLEIAFCAKPGNRHRIDHLMEVVLRVFGLAQLREQTVGRLSGGQRKLVELAFAVCTKPSILLLDEPFSGLDPIKVAQISNYLKMLAKLGLGIILTDHKVHDTLNVVERVCIINEGQLIHSGHPRLAIQDPIVRQVFLGESFSL